MMTIDRGSRKCRTRISGSPVVGEPKVTKMKHKKKCSILMIWCSEAGSENIKYRLDTFRGRMGKTQVYSLEYGFVLRSTECQLTLLFITAREPQGAASASPQSLFAGCGGWLMDEPPSLVSMMHDTVPFNISLIPSPPL